MKEKKGRKAPPVEAADYDPVFARLAANIPDLVAWISQQKHFAEEFCEALLQMPEAARTSKVRDLARVEPWSVAFALLHGAMQSADLEVSSALAALAIVAAKAIREPAQPSTSKAGLLGHAQLLLGVALFRGGRTKEADKALVAAETQLAKAIPGGPRSRLLLILSRLRRVGETLAGAHKKFERLFEQLENRLEELSE